VRKLWRGCCIVSLGFGRAATLFDVVIVVCNGRGYCRYESKICFFLRRVDFVVEDSTETLHDRHVLDSDLEIPASAIAHKDIVALLV
jgi:hypothetical protein